MATTSRLSGSHDLACRASAAAPADHDPLFATFGGTAGDDTLVGTNHDDVMSGLGGRDLLLGRGGHDLIDGDGGFDTLDGGRGRDTLNAADGWDRLAGGLGVDSMAGGRGRDVFSYRHELDSQPSERDVISDYGIQLDRIDLAAVDAVRGGAANEAFTFIGSGPFTAAGQIRVIRGPEKHSTLVEANTVGTDGAEMQILLQNVSGSHMTAADFVL